MNPLVWARFEACRKAYLPRWITDKYEIVLEGEKVRLKLKVGTNK